MTVTPTIADQAKAARKSVIKLSALTLALAIVTAFLTLSFLPGVSDLLIGLSGALGSIFLAYPFLAEQTVLKTKKKHLEAIERTRDDRTLFPTPDAFDTEYARDAESFDQQLKTTSDTARFLNWFGLYLLIYAFSKPAIRYILECAASPTG
ncbi:MAG: hypothetical protein VX464_16310 [Pseudomonadota bacterium]|nr:hypothetical protein [Pseudomonadota bacterium]